MNSLIQQLILLRAHHVPATVLGIRNTKENKRTKPLSSWVSLVGKQRNPERQVKTLTSSQNDQKGTLWREAEAVQRLEVQRCSEQWTTGHG